MGSGYVIEHCIAAFRANQAEEIYKTYITDSFYVIVHSLGNGDALPKRYQDIMHPETEDKRTGDEIAADIIKRHGLKVVN